MGYRPSAHAIEEEQPMTAKPEQDELIWAYLLHLGYNMWCDREIPGTTREYWTAKPYLRCEIGFWHELIDRMATAGINMVVIDLGEGVRYESHPELAVRGSWTRDQLRDELDRIRDKGIEPIPKLNFSAGHDVWLGEYSRCLSTTTYYTVCSDLIAEVLELFDGPRFFHLGMDEETAQHQREYAYVVIRQHELWWHDFNLYVEAVEKAGARPWIWSDYMWRHPDLFFENMPKSVLQSNWYYGETFKEDETHVAAYLKLEKHGYDQIPTGSNWSNPDNFQKTVAYCSTRIPRPRLKGFLQTPWKPTLEACRDRHIAAIEQVARARAGWAKS
jgi:hypothetical protein